MVVQNDRLAWLDEVWIQSGVDWEKSLWSWPVCSVPDLWAMAYTTDECVLAGWTDSFLSSARIPDARVSNTLRSMGSNPVDTRPGIRHA